MTTLPIALQLYTLRDAIAESGLKATLEQVADIGYIGVEPYGGLDATETAQICKALGLQITSAHLGLPIGEDTQKEIDRAKTLGIHYFVIPYFDPATHFSTLDGVRQVCERLNQAHANVKANGMQLLYHNHWFEYEMVENRLPYQVMLERLDEDIAFELDTYWVKVGGQDPLSVLNELSARTPLLHVKDGSATDIETPMVAVGAGSLDYHAIVEAGKDNLQWLIVELDRCATDMMEAVTQSYQYLVDEGLGHGK